MHCLFRLVTRGTYEREMFDRASMKLGLDKALLQSSSAIGGEEFLDPSKAVASLSRTEVEDLLKKGAYGKF